jgi:glucokinase
VDVARGITRFLPNLPTQWRDVPVRERLAPLVEAPVYLLNDARAATLGEMEFGAGRTASTFLCFTLGTGIGGGVVIERRLRLGPLGAAGEIGHIVVESAGPRCGCGTTGCLETFASGPALTAEAVRLVTSGNSAALQARVGGELSRLNPAVLGEVARAGDEACLRVIERAGEKLGIASASLVTALHPDLIVLVGGVAGLADLLIPAMRRVIVARVHMFPVDDLRIERSPLGDRAGVLGALALAIRGGSVGAA